MMIGLLVFLTAFCVLSYHRASLLVWTLSLSMLLFFFSWWATPSTFALISLWTVFLLVFLPLNIYPIRRRLISTHIFKFYCDVMPSMSRTEREALSAGTVTWEGDLFQGNPNWEKLSKFPAPMLTAEEEAFLKGPVSTVCAMTHDWDITHNRADLPPEMWTFLKENGFFGLIIPKKYGGKGFSAYAHSQIIVKLNTRSVTVATSVSVPNSLGPAELLLHYGTEEQKNYYLPRLARGEEIPCFALTSAHAGSDAGAMTDTGIVTWGEYQGERTLGILLNFDKRYITMAPIATVIGLAFKLYDPDNLIGSKKEIGITCALIPRNTPGISIGRRHFPVNTPFQNGPIHGRNIFIPLDWVIGGKSMVGQGWRMLMESLAAGRSISLPSISMGGAKTAVYATGAYARIRRQFNMPIARFEGVDEVLARIVGHAYIMDAARSFTVGMVDLGEKPAVASAIVKYHTTELARKIANDAMDVHGGKGIMLGPKNYLGLGYGSVPIAITVEGANILTRNLIIFGQGVMRCHPYIFKEYEAAKMKDSKAGLKAFDKEVIKHVGYAFSNLMRSLILGFTSARIVRAPANELKRYFQHMTRFSSAFAMLTDMYLLVLGGNVKRRERTSARLGDILSYLYLMSAVLKHYEDQGSPSEDLPIIRWICEDYLYQIQLRFNELLENFPNRWIGLLLRLIIFPLGQNFAQPSDKLSHKLAQLITSPTATRSRLAAGIFLGKVEGNVMVDIDDAFVKSIASEPIEKTIRAAKVEGTIQGYNFVELARAALEKKIITQQELDIVMSAHEARQRVIAVDDFAADELARVVTIVNSSIAVG